MNENVIKIALIGEHNAGKSTILRYITEKICREKPIKPTLGVEMRKLQFIDTEIVIWDFGGQKAYKKLYEQNPKRFFFNLKYMYYVVDIQDKDLIEESAIYFKKVLELISENNSKYMIIILFHKFDPDLKNSDEAKESAELFKKLIDERLKKTNMKQRNYYTSIYDVDSINNALMDSMDIKKIQECIE